MRQDARIKDQTNEPELDPAEEMTCYWDRHRDDVQDMLDEVKRVWAGYCANALGAPDLLTATMVTEVAVATVANFQNDSVRRTRVHEGIANIVASPPEAKAWFTLHAFRDAGQGHRYPRPVKTLEHRPEGRRADVYTKEWEAEDRFLIQYINELQVEVEARMRDIRRGSNTFGIQEQMGLNNVDMLSMSLHNMRVHSKVMISTMHNALWLHAIRSVAGAQVSKPAREVEALAHAEESYHSTLVANGFGVSMESQALIEEMRSLRGAILFSDFSRERYLALRCNTPADHPLCGLHRDYWSSIDRPFLEKEELLLKMEKASIPDRPGSSTAREAFCARHIMPPHNPHFLRDENPAFAGKLLVNLLVLREQHRLNVANNSPQIFAMAHLYNALHQLGYLSQSKHDWPLLERVINIHLKPIFLGDRPTTTDAIFSRLLLAYGCPLAHVQSLDKLCSSPAAGLDSKKLLHNRNKSKPYLLMHPQWSHSPTTSTTTTWTCSAHCIA